jgi:hypothetical protein
MPRVKVGPAPPDKKPLDIEIARLRDLNIRDLRARWHNAFGRRPPPHLPRHLMFRVLAYRLQVERLGDLDAGSQRLLDGAGPAEDAGKRAMDQNRRTTDVRPSSFGGRSCWRSSVDYRAVWWGWRRVRRRITGRASCVRWAMRCADAGATREGLREAEQE